VRKIQLAKTGLNKIKANHKELKSTDLGESIKSLSPGEWCALHLPGNNEAWVAYVNPLIDDKYPCAQIVDSISMNEINSFDPAVFIKTKIKTAFKQRIKFKGYETGSRIFYGTGDGLAGLIIDHFSNACIIQVNTAGIDRYRDLINATVSEVTQTASFFLDNPKYREKEFLPTFETKVLPPLEVVENGLSYKLRSEIIQKVGFYYDHRENRIQLQYLLNRLKKLPSNAVDLFSYTGAWGLNALKAGLKQVDFVDQGDFGIEVSEALKINGFTGQGTFFRQDVFKFLDDSISKGKKYDLILCDPPAFAKSSLQKIQALEGYSKLHRKVFKTTNQGGLCCFSSCTHYISHEEFQKNISDAALKEGKKIQLVYCGMQGWDHPVKSLEDRSNYIKSYFYILE